MHKIQEIELLFKTGIPVYYRNFGQCKYTRLQSCPSLYFYKCTLKDQLRKLKIVLRFFHLISLTPIYAVSLTIRAISTQVKWINSTFRLFWNSWAALKVPDFDLNSYIGKNFSSQSVMLTHLLIQLSAILDKETLQVKSNAFCKISLQQDSDLESL